MERGLGQDVVEEVRQATDIVELIGAYVDLRPGGRDFKACCPFHREKTPSFHVSPQRQLFHCFGCGVGGDAFSFIMQHEGLSFREALELLANRAGISLPEREGGGAGHDRAQIHSALRAAVRFYRGKLQSAAGERARRYLEERAVTPQLVDNYYLGLAPGGGQALLRLASKRFPSEVLVQAGLVGQGDGGRLYDRFRDRLVIPILGVAGEPIGFGARAMRPEVEPKYLNSPETAVYKKNRVLFGLPQARAAIRAAQHALIVEGYFDVLGLSAAGIQNAVAPCGTAWTAEHARLILRFTPRCVLLFDGDQAGVKAAWRALEATLPRHADLGVVVLPSGMDPDDMIREGRQAELEEMIAAPLSPVAFAAEALNREGVDGHPRLLRIAGLLACVGNAVAREMMLDEAAERTRVRVAALRQEVERLQGLSRTRRPAGPTDETPAEALRMTPLEEQMLLLACSSPGAVTELLAASRGVAVVRGSVRRLLAWVGERGAGRASIEPAELLGQMRAHLGESVKAGFLLGGPTPDAGFRRNLLRHLKKLTIEAELEELGHRIKTAEAEGGSSEKLAELLARKKERAIELRRLMEPESEPDT